MGTKALRALRLPIRRGLSEAEASIYVGVGLTKFREMVIGALMPRPRILSGVRSFDIAELDAAFYNSPVEEGAETKKPPDSWADYRGGV